MATRNGLNAFIEAYIECALWSSTHWDEDGNMLGCLDDYCAEFSPELMAETVKDCTNFFEAHRHLWADERDYDDASAGHDFWLTRNGHGAGFWDRGIEHGDEMSAACRPYGGVDLVLELDEGSDCEGVIHGG